MTVNCPSCRSAVSVWSIVLSFAAVALVVGFVGGFGIGWLAKPEPKKERINILPPPGESSWDMMQHGAKRAEERDRQR